MFGLFLTSAYVPFTVAFVVMIGIGLIEAIGLGVGSLDLHADIGGDVDGPDLLGWLGLGDGLPILIWLTSLLGCFTLAGVGIQQLAAVLFGAPLHWGIATAGAAVIGLIANVFAASGLARIMPGYESTVVSVEDLLMRRGTILEGTARRGHPARAKVVDQHGQAHYVMVEPHNDSDIVAPGETALLVRRAGPTFFVVPDVNPSLRPI
ncbi:MAG: OB-fold-containig protein [Sphingomonas sp.]